MVQRCSKTPYSLRKSMMWICCGDFDHQPYHTTTKWCFSFEEKNGMNSRDQLNPCTGAFFWKPFLWVSLHGKWYIKVTVVLCEKLSRKPMFRLCRISSHRLSWKILSFYWGLVKVESKLQVCGNQFQSQSRALLEWKTPGKPRRSSAEIKPWSSASIGMVTFHREQKDQKPQENVKAFN